jgi:integrative and conjugative element protein (TIGR02256 family)
VEVAPKARTWVPTGALDHMITETQRWSRLETGGILVDYCSEDSLDVVVTQCTVSRPNARHGKCRDTPDYESDRQAMERLFGSHNGRLFYLGDWRSHPGREPALSRLDKRALRNMAKFLGNCMESPAMLILGEGATDARWSLAGWHVHRRSGSILFSRWRYHSQTVMPYELTR